MKLFFVSVKLYSLLYRFLECISIRRCKIYYVRIYSFFFKTGHNDRFLFLVFSLHSNIRQTKTIKMSNLNYRRN